MTEGPMPAYKDILCELKEHVAELKALAAGE